MAKRPAAPNRTHAGIAPIWPALVLLILPLVVYAPLRSARFIWDDDLYVIENQTLRSLDGLRQMWFEPRSIPQYYPLVHTTFWLEYQQWELNPTGYHVTNVLLHAIAAVLLWRLLLRLEVPGAWLAAAIFAVHPVMVESVAWVTERKNVLSLPLALGAALCYLRFQPAQANAAAAAHRWRWYGAALVLFAGALLSKSVVFSLPAVLLVLFWWKRGRITWGDVWPLLPFFAIGIAAGATTAWLEKYHVGALGAEWDFSPLDRVLLAGRVAWFYAGKLVWPHPLIFFYPRWEIDAGVWWQYLYPAGVLAVVVALWLARGRLGRGPLAAVLIFLGVLTPALGFFDVYPFRYSFVADHFQYHASLGLIALAAATAATVCARWPRVWTPAVRNIVCATLLVVLGVLTYQQAQVYQNIEVLYRDILAKNPTSWNTWINLANLLADAGRKDEALQVARQGLEARPDVAGIHLHYGAHLLGAGGQAGPRPEQVQAAIEAYQRALELQPDVPDGTYNLAQALSLAGRHREAIEAFEQTLQQHPGDEQARFGLGKAHFDLANRLMQEQQPAEAAGHYREAIRLQPNSAQSHNNLGIALMNLDEVDAAMASFRQALVVEPGFAEAERNLKRAQQQLDTTRSRP